MTRRLLAPALMLALLSGLPSGAADKFKLIHAEDLAALLAQKSPVVVYDVNTPEFRAKKGIVPGARLLSSSGEYDVAKELPADKGTPLVFYCANTH